MLGRWALPDGDTRLVLIRHGESVAQVEGFLSGHDTCRGLSPAGPRAGDGAARPSPLDRRARRGRCALHEHPPAHDRDGRDHRPRLRRDQPPAKSASGARSTPARRKGSSWDTFRERFPAIDDPHDPFRQRIPGAETWAEFYVRAGTRLRRVADEHRGERVVVVCHGGIIGASFVALGDLPIGSGTALTHETVNTSLTEWRFAGGEWRLVRYNDAAHLAVRVRIRVGVAVDQVASVPATASPARRSRIAAASAAVSASDGSSTPSSAMSAAYCCSRVRHTGRQRRRRASARGRCPACSPGSTRRGARSARRSRARRRPGGRGAAARRTRPR